MKFSTEDQDNDEAPNGKYLSIVFLTVQCIYWSTKTHKLQALEFFFVNINKVSTLKKNIYVLKLNFVSVLISKYYFQCKSLQLKLIP